MNRLYVIILSSAAARFLLNDLINKDLSIETAGSYWLCNKTVPDVNFLKKEFL